MNESDFLVEDILFFGESDNLSVYLDGKSLSNRPTSVSKRVLELESLEKEDDERICIALGRGFPFIEGFDERLVLPKLFLKDKSLEEITIYGGAFNPWHEGHNSCVELCKSSNLVIIPDNNPWKESVNRKSVFAFYLELCHLLADKRYSIFPGFLGLNISNPTISWLPKVQTKKVNLLIGDDNFLKFEKWQEAEKILNMLNVLYVCPREGDSEEINEKSKWANSVNPELIIKLLKHHDFEHVSSTKIRQEK